VGDLVAEHSSQIVGASAGVLQDVVEQTGLEADQVHVEVGEDESDVEGVDDIGVAGVPDLVPMALGGKAIRAFEDADILPRPELSDLGFELAEELPGLVRGAQFGGSNGLGGIRRHKRLGRRVNAARILL
jgi:hypothetical protein